MRHRVVIKKLKRVKSHREALVRSLARSLILNSEIKTTVAKAKVVQSFTERLITLSKHKSLFAKQQLLKKLHDAQAVDILIKKLSTEFSDRDGGYTSIRKIGYRQGDGASMAKLKIIDTKASTKK